MVDLETEQVRVMFFESRSLAMLDERTWPGTVNQVEVDIRDIIRHALLLGSPTLVFAHNHPSGNAQPSKQDIALTKRLHDTCKTMGITLYDHIIVARNGSFSFRDFGYM